ncbi:MAG TPA: isoprenylcysteine carboxylmethyltransferase family protein [Candidatus Baltobacteraceae bacterium]|jgi:protein-S-isoprenylcysteine O-methyltransferase Ste14|nr:isoprenylcysteine carboxylmethyltransferase family protein [Candidatus Baltobacteraceae bacterium]
MREPGRIIPPEPPIVAADDPRATVFKNRGALLALPAVALATLGKPSAFSIAVGLPVAFAGEAIRCWAVGYSGATTRADHVTVQHLTTAGPYAYVRNPLYVGNFLTALGFGIAFTGALPRERRKLLIGAGLATMASVYSTIVPLEESYLERKFGREYVEYRAAVPQWIPKCSPVQETKGTYDVSTIAKAESRTFLTFGVMLLALAAKALKK